MSLFQVTMKGKLYGQDCVNVVHFTKPEATANDMLLLAQSVANEWIGHVAFTQTTFFTWVMLQVTHLDNNPMAPVILPLNVGGQFFSSPAAWGPMSFVYQFKTFNSRARNGHGRVYISGIYAELEQGVWTPQRLGFMRGVSDHWKQHFVGDTPASTFNLVLRGRDEQEPDVRLVTDIVARPYPGSQVRRNLFRGQ